MPGMQQGVGPWLASRGKRLEAAHLPLLQQQQAEASHCLGGA